jgi:plasmid stability protein
VERQSLVGFKATSYACILHAIIISVATPLQIRNMPDDALEALRERAAKRHLSLAAYAREVLVREAARAAMEETLAGPRAIAGRHLTPREVRQLIRPGRA